MTQVTDRPTSGIQTVTSAATRTVIHGLIAKAEGKIAALERQIEVQRLHIAELRAELGEDAHGFGDATSDPKPETPRRAPAPPNGRAPLKTGERKSVVKMMVEVMRAHNGPMRGADITAELKRRGVTSAAKHGLRSNVFSELKRRRDLFEKVDRGVYRLK